jgi:S1-C subfamily serine protease
MPNGKSLPGQPSGPSIHKANTGSGFIVRPDGFIMTNAHVVKGSSKIKVSLADKRTFDAKVIGMDGFTDLAVIKINATDLPTLKLGTSANLRPGDFAIAIGSPLNFDHSVTFGIISAVGRSVSDINGNINFLQTDAAINPGNSGGPLLNFDGEVIGINTAMQRNAQSIGFSIPIDVAKAISDDLIAGHAVQRPWLGISMKDIDDVFAKILELAPTVKGVYIQQLVDKGPAQRAGLMTGDIIQKIDGNLITTGKQVRETVLAHKVQDTIHVTVLRAKNEVVLPVALGAYPDAPPSAEAVEPQVEE